MSWITDDWRLKVLALGLAILMLGAVAFSQNPPTTKSLVLSIHYPFTVGQNGDLVIVNPPSTVRVTIQGPADAVGNATADNFSANVDASHATQGPAVKLNINVNEGPNGITVTNPAPIVVKIDKLVPVDIPVNVSAHGAVGWSISTDKPPVATPAKVHFVGPASWEDHIAATVVVGPPIAVTTTNLLNQPVQLTNINGAVSYTTCTTDPCATLDPAFVAVTIFAQAGASSNTVPLNGSVSQPPPQGYQLVGIKVDPATLIITGDPAALAKIQRIILPGVDLSSQTTTETVQVNIPFPDGVTPLSGVQTAKVTYTIQKIPSVSPSP